jgi:hypothetical protein
MDQAQHLDAERLAAFMDGSLSRAERAAVEAHAADCGPCLQLLAAMVRTEPPVPARTWRLPIVLRWAVPLAAAATALALWVNVERGTIESERSPAPSDRIDAVAPAPPPAAASTQPKVSPNAAPVEPLRQAARAAPGPASKPVASDEAMRDKVQQLTARNEQRRSEPDAPKREAFGPERKEAAAQPTPPPPPASPPAAPVAAPAAAGAAPAPAVDTLRSRVAESPAALKAPSLPLEIVSPDPMVRWRADKGGIQRSTDGGKTWGAPVTVAADVLAGSSPSPNVAWVAGRAGAVFLTVDGSAWQRLSFPEPIDLRAIRASSARDAAVTLSDGRVFRTTDGGRTWSLQEP